MRQRLNPEMRVRIENAIWDERGQLAIIECAVLFFSKHRQFLTRLLSQSQLSFSVLQACDPGLKMP